MQGTKVSGTFFLFLQSLSPSLKILAAPVICLTLLTSDRWDTSRVRCDRYHPCERCQRRNASAECIYAPSIASPTVSLPRPHHPAPVIYRGHSLESEASLARAAHQQSRLTVRASQQHADSAPWDRGEVAEGSIGRIDVDQNETNYVGGEHWAVLADKVSVARARLFL